MLPMNTIVSTPFWFFIVNFIFILLVLSLIITFAWILVNKWRSDKIIFVDKNNRWHLKDAFLYGKETYVYKDKKYHLNKDGGNMGRRGKVLYIFSINNPVPMKEIDFKAPQWLDAQSL